MNKIKLSAILFLFLALLSSAQGANWEKMKTDRLLEALKSEEFAKISSALTNIANNFKEIPANDRKQLEVQIYQLLESDIPVPDLKNQPQVIRINFPVNTNAGIVLGRIKGYEKHTPLPANERELAVFKRWYEKNHLKNSENQIHRGDISNKKRKKVEDIDPEYKIDEYQANYFIEISKGRDTSNRLIEEETEAKREKLPGRLPWIIAGVLLLGILALLLLKTFKGKSPS